MPRISTASSPGCVTARGAAPNLGGRAQPHRAAVDTLSTPMNTRDRLGVVLLLLALATTACKRSPRDTPDEPARARAVVPPPPPAPPPAAPEALARKARSEAVLRAAGVAINPHLPVIETATTTTIRTTTEAVDRTLALTMVALKGGGLPQDEVLAAVTRFDAARFLSPREHAFVGDDNPTEADRAQAAWRHECLGVLLWALGFDATLPPPGHLVEVADVITRQGRLGAKGFRAKAVLRSADELLDQADLIYRYAWACVDARVRGAATPTGVDCDVVQERHYVLNWLIGYQGRAWDDVSTDT